MFGWMFGAGTTSAEAEADPKPITPAETEPESGASEPEAKDGFFSSMFGKSDATETVEVKPEVAEPAEEGFVATVFRRSLMPETPQPEEKPAEPAEEGFVASFFRKSQIAQTPEPKADVEPAGFLASMPLFGGPSSKENEDEVTPLSGNDQETGFLKRISRAVGLESEPPPPPVPAPVEVAKTDLVETVMGGMQTLGDAIIESIPVGRPSRSIAKQGGVNTSGPKRQLPSVVEKEVENAEAVIEHAEFENAEPDDAEAGDEVIEFTPEPKKITKESMASSNISEKGFESSDFDPVMVRIKGAPDVTPRKDVPHKDVRISVNELPRIPIANEDHSNYQNIIRKDDHVVNDARTGSTAADGVANTKRSSADDDEGGILANLGDAVLQSLPMGLFSVDEDGDEEQKVTDRTIPQKPMSPDTYPPIKKSETQEREFPTSVDYGADADNTVRTSVAAVGNMFGQLFGENKTVVNFIHDSDESDKSEPPPESGSLLAGLFGSGATASGNAVVQQAQEDATAHATAHATARTPLSEKTTDFGDAEDDQHLLPSLLDRTGNNWSETKNSEPPKPTPINANNIAMDKEVDAMASFRKSMRTTANVALDGLADLGEVVLQRVDQSVVLGNQPSTRPEREDLAIAKD